MLEAKRPAAICIHRRRDALVDRAVFITETPAEDLRAAAKAVMAGPPDLPLWGIPGEHGYLTLGMLAAAEAVPYLPIPAGPGPAAAPG